MKLIRNKRKLHGFLNQPGDTWFHPIHDRRACHLDLKRMQTAKTEAVMGQAGGKADSYCSWGRTREEGQSEGRGTLSRRGRIGRVATQQTQYSEKSMAVTIYTNWRIRFVSRIHGGELCEYTFFSEANLELGKSVSVYIAHFSPVSFGKMIL